MIVTPLKVFRLSSTRLEPVIRDDRLVLSQVEEFIAWYRGEDACHVMVKDVINILEGNMPELRDRMIKKTETINIICSDGTLLYASKVMLRRQYHFFDDFFTEFPDEEVVRLPFPSDQITATLAYFPYSELKKCYECLSHFNPKSTLLYFDRATRNTSPDILIHLTNQLTYQERKWILEARRMSKGAKCPLPDEGMGLGILGHVLERYYDSDNIAKVFSDYPSYVTMMTHNSLSILKLLLTCNYDSGEICDNLKESDYCLVFSSIACLCSDQFFRQSPLEDKKKYVRKIMTMMGVRHPLFENEDMEVTLPYYVEWNDDYDEELDEKTVSEVFGVSEEVVIDIVKNKKKGVKKIPIIDLDTIDFEDDEEP